MGHRVNVWKAGHLQSGGRDTKKGGREADKGYGKTETSSGI